ncbi:protein yellow-like [Cloeon dipterum]|uniref:protein yellow-like n=1 Tax=Cloeon dipterum TaxID=197152 RepID=UPI00322041AC
MSPLLSAIFLLGLSSLVTAANFTQVFQWDELDFEWPSEASRTQALKTGGFTPENIYPHYIAVYGTRIFLSLNKYNINIPATLVSLPTSSASSSAPPKFTPFPSWEMNEYNRNCNRIQEAKGLEVDSLGRLWVLDQGSNNCNAKLWTIDLSNGDDTKLIHQFLVQKRMYDLVLDETPSETLAFLSQWGEQRITVFSLERNESWIVHTPGIEFLSIALSPKKEPRQLYLSKWNSEELYSISVAALRNGTRTANPKLIGKWNSRPYRMLMDTQGIMYAAFMGRTYTSSWNTSQPFQEQRFYEVARQDTVLPFTLALDQNGTLWMTLFDKDKKPRFRILKAAVGAKSYIFESSPVTPTISKETNATPVTSTE